MNELDVKYIISVTYVYKYAEAYFVKLLLPKTKNM